MRRHAFIIYVNLDPVPGSFYTQESALRNVGGILTNFLSHYEPSVGNAPAEFQPEDGGRVSIVAFINLDPMAEFPRRFGLQAVRHALRESVPHYYPVVSYAPRILQPDYTEGIITA